MVARVKWCKPVSSCTRLRPNVECFNSRKGGKLAAVRNSRNRYRRRMYPLDKGGELAVRSGIANGLFTIKRDLTGI